MIVKEVKIKWILKADGMRIFFFVIYGAIVWLLYELYFYEIRFSISEISIFEVAVAILIGFRNNEAYNRYWEARIAWGDLTNISRNFAAEVISYIQLPSVNSKNLSATHLQAVHEELIYRHLAFLNALRIQLRGQTQWGDLEKFLTPNEQKKLPLYVNKATQLNHRQATRLKELNDAGWIVNTNAYVFGLMKCIKDFYVFQGVCERIKNTPLPRQYAFFTKSFVWIFVLLLPFTLVQHLGWGTLPIYVLISSIFMITERIGRRVEDPFENKIEDVAMSAICRNIEIDLRQQLGETDVPPALEPVDGILM